MWPGTVVAVILHLAHVMDVDFTCFWCFDSQNLDHSIPHHCADSLQVDVAQPEMPVHQRTMLMGDGPCWAIASTDVQPSFSTRPRSIHRG